VQICCGGWGDVSLPRAAEEIEIYVTSTRGREPVPDWVVKIVRILADEGEPHFKPLKIRTYIILKENLVLTENNQAHARIFATKTLPTSLPTSLLSETPGCSLILFMRMIPVDMPSYCRRSRWFTTDKAVVRP
jgi:hypothetical protein